MWRFTAAPVKILVIDARALLPIAVFLVHMRLWTLIVAGIGVAAFSLLAFFGFTLPVAWRVLRVLICGPIRRRLPASKMRDYA